MCYSAQLDAAYHRFVKEHGAILDIHAFKLMYEERRDVTKMKIPRAVDAWFSAPVTEEEKQIHALIASHDAAAATTLEQELFKQKKRLADAERTLLTKTTQSATESKRIASNKIDWALRKLSELRRTSLLPGDSRIFPGWYAPVMIWENGRRVVKPMRYQCRPAGVPADFDSTRPGCYNARRDNLERFWRHQFGFSHGLMAVNAFYENVAQDGKNVVLEFRPNPPQPMWVACLWSHWRGPGQPDLLSFAAITDEPPPEIAAAGHDRVIIPIKAEHINAWLNPDPNNRAASYAILDDRERPFYEHRMAA